MAYYQRIWPFIQLTFDATTLLAALISVVVVVAVVVAGVVATTLVLLVFSTSVVFTTTTAAIFPNVVPTGGLLGRTGVTARTEGGLLAVACCCCNGLPGLPLLARAVAVVVGDDGCVSALFRCGGLVFSVPTTGHNKWKRGVNSLWKNKDVVCIPTAQVDWIGIHWALSS